MQRTVEIKQDYDEDINVYYHGKLIGTFYRPFCEYFDILEEGKYIIYVKKTNIKNNLQFKKCSQMIKSAFHSEVFKNLSFNLKVGLTYNIDVKLLEKY